MKKREKERESKNCNEFWRQVSVPKLDTRETEIEPSKFKKGPVLTQDVGCLQDT